jgi:hypothetical protein
VVGRTAALLALLVALFAYDDLASRLWSESVWWDVVWIALVLMPATFGMVLLALPLYRARNLVVIGLSLVALTLALTIAHADVSANFARLAAATVIAWAFLRVFETVGLVVFVACIIPWVDAYSVWRGPTKTITSHHPHVFTDLSYAFPVPGQHSAANLGVPDLLFFAFFLAAAKRFELRVIPTWICMVAGLGGTIALVVAVNVGGLPALPGIALGFLVPNADLLWQRLRRKPRLSDSPDVALDGATDDG